jgi:hypothetical protein
MSEIDSVSEPEFDRGEWVNGVHGDDSSSVGDAAFDKKKHNNRDKKSVFRVYSGKGPARVSYFDTNLTPGRRIRNAVSGYFTNHFVGTSDEYLYFSNLICTGEGGTTPHCLFYDTPEQYERHMHTTLSDDSKDRWRQRYNELLKEQQDRLSNRSESVIVK